MLDLQTVVDKMKDAIFKNDLEEGEVSNFRRGFAVTRTIRGIYSRRVATGRRCVGLGRVEMVVPLVLVPPPPGTM